MASNNEFSRYFRAQSNYFTITHYAGNVSNALNFVLITLISLKNKKNAYYTIGNKIFRV